MLISIFESSIDNLHIGDIQKKYIKHLNRTCLESEEGASDNLMVKAIFSIMGDYDVAMKSSNINQIQLLINKMNTQIAKIYNNKDMLEKEYGADDVQQNLGIANGYINDVKNHAKDIKNGSSSSSTPEEMSSSSSSSSAENDATAESSSSSSENDTNVDASSSSSANDAKVDASSSSSESDAKVDASSSSSENDTKDDASSSSSANDAKVDASSSSSANDAKVDASSSSSESDEHSENFNPNDGFDRGEINHSVTDIQKKLNVKQDGSLGPVTIRALQKKSDLPETGILDNLTLLAAMIAEGYEEDTPIIGTNPIEIMQNKLGLESTGVIDEPTVAKMNDIVHTLSGTINIQSKYLTDITYEMIINLIRGGDITRNVPKEIETPKEDGTIPESIHFTDYFTVVTVSSAIKALYAEKEKSDKGVDKAEADVKSGDAESDVKTDEKTGENNGEAKTAPEQTDNGTVPNDNGGEKKDEGTSEINGKDDSKPEQPTLKQTAVSMQEWKNKYRNAKTDEEKNTAKSEYEKAKKTYIELIKATYPKLPQDDVLLLQLFLNTRGANLKTDGILGINTVSALQRSEKRTVDGIFGNDTKAIYKAIMDDPSILLAKELRVTERNGNARKYDVKTAFEIVNRIKTEDIPFLKKQGKSEQYIYDNIIAGHKLRLTYDAKKALAHLVTSTH